MEQRRCAETAAAAAARELTGTAAQAAGDLGRLRLLRRPGRGGGAGELDRLQVLRRGLGASELAGSK